MNSYWSESHLLLFLMTSSARVAYSGECSTRISRAACEQLWESRRKWYFLALIILPLLLDLYILTILYFFNNNNPTIRQNKTHTNPRGSDCSQPNITFLLYHQTTNQQYTCRTNQQLKLATLTSIIIPISSLGMFARVLLILAFSLICPCQYFKRMIASSPYMNIFPFSFYPLDTSAYSQDWTINTNLYITAYLNNLQILYTTTINSISSGPNTYGYEINPKITSMWATGIQISISDTNVDQENAGFVWFSVTFIIFLVPNNSPIGVQTLTAMIYSNIGNNLYVLTNSTYQLQFALNSTLTSTCYYDQAKTIKDTIQLIPTLNQVSIQNPYYINLTSTSNWQYAWDNTTSSLNFNTMVATYTSQALYIVVNVVAVCVNSYIFVTNNYSISASPSNWFQLTANTNGQNTSTTVQLSTPFGTDSSLMLGQSITGVALHLNNMSQLFASFNISYAYDVLGELMGYEGSLTYFTLMPQNCYINYWGMGFIGGCPTNFATYNQTHCYCNPAQNLTYDSLYSVYKCRSICPFGYYFSYSLGTCQSCQITYSFLCSTCNNTACFNCTNGLNYYLKNTTVLCLNCSFMFGGGCLLCSDQQCLQCGNNFVINSSQQCQCIGGDRYLSTYGIQELCVLCSTTFTNCLNCTASACTLCSNSYSLSNGSCSCLSPSRMLNGTCYNCSSLYGVGCLNCSSFCTTCSTGYYLSANATCLNCSSLYNQYCVNCNGTQCLSCATNFVLNALLTCTCPSLTYIIINGSCTPCSYQIGCLTCNSSACLSCSSSFLLTNGSCICSSNSFYNGSSCVSCSSVYPQCLECNSTTCLECPALYLLTNDTCNCSGDRYLLAGICTLCSQLGLGCIECSSSGICTECSANFNLVNGSCSCGTGFALSGSLCLSCTQLFGVGCSTCTLSACVACGQNFVMNSSLCQCPSPSYALFSGACQQCSSIYPQCLSCTNSTCLLCQSNFQFTNNTCTCNQNRYINLLGVCQLCYNTYNNCYSCWWDHCLSCNENYTLSSEGCVCSWPMMQNPNSSACMRCQDLQESESCSLTVSIDSFQSGKWLYFWLVYNQPNDQINYLVGIQYNLKVMIGGQQTSFTQQTSGFFQIQLSGIQGEENVNVLVVDKQYVQYGALQLNNEPGNFSIQLFGNLGLDLPVITTIFQVRNYMNAVLLGLSLGVLNRLFQQLNVVALIGLAEPNIPNSLGSVLDLLNKQSIYTPIPVVVPFENRLLPSNDLNMSVYNFNKPILNLSAQLILFTLCGFCLSIYVRGYLKQKRHFDRHRAFRNILDHSGEYIVENFICVTSVLTFPAMYQLKLLLANGFSHLDIDDGANLVVTICLLVAPICLCIVYYLQFPPKARRYSILYFQFKSQRALVVLLTLVSCLRQYVIGAIVLFISSSVNQYFILACNLIHLFLVVVCVPLCLTKWSYFFLITKTILGAYVNIVFLFGQQDTLIVRVAAYAVVAIVLVEGGEAVFKLVRLILRNKGVIKDTYEPIERSPEEINQDEGQKRKEITSQMLSFLSKAKDELGQIVKNRRKRRID